MFAGFFNNFHTRETVRLAWPLVITQVGHILTGMVDNIFLGQIGPAEQAAGIFSGNLYVLLLVFTIGMSYGATPLVTVANENRDVRQKSSLFFNSLFLNVLVAVLCFVILFSLSPYLKYMRQPADVVLLAVPFFNVIVLSIIPLSLFFTCKQYCEGLSNTRMALFISIAGNAINIALNYIFIYGKLGIPSMGYMGAAWASFYSRLFMGLAFMVLVFRSGSTNDFAAMWRVVKLNLKDLAELWKIGINSAMQFIFEVAAFVFAGLMAGSFGKEQIDSHGIALNLAAFTYMFGSGISSASTIRAGIFMARNDWEGIRNASLASIKLVMLVMGSFGVLFLLFNDHLPVIFSAHAGIIHLASQLLLIAAMFQLFDGLQVTVIGILRGLEDVKVPTLITLIGYWVIALPLAYFLAFTLKMETFGIWIALLVSLVFVATCALWRLRVLIRRHTSASVHP